MNKHYSLLFLIMTCFLVSSCGEDKEETINIEDNNSPPIVNLDQAQINAVGGDEIIINVDAQDPDEDDLTYDWSQINNEQLALDLSQVDNEGNLTLLLPSVEENTIFEIVLTVSDGTGSVSLNVILNVVKANPTPIAQITGRNSIAKVIQWPLVDTGNVAILSMAGSIGINPKWTVTAFPQNSQYELTSENSGMTGFYADTEGEYSIQLSLDNGQGLTDNANYKINVVLDSDGDGVIDKEDGDKDGDGYSNIEDLFKDDKASHSDTDGNGVSNYHQADEDQDGVSDYDDPFPFDSQITTLIPYQESMETNSNDGIAVAELIDIVPTKIKGELSSTGGYDQDYYRLPLDEGRVTINIETLDSSKPILSMVNSAGQQIPYIDIKLVGSQISGAINAIITEQDNYYLVVANQVSNAVSYEIDVFYDADQDGLSDKLELAIDSNPQSIDSDSDGIPDGVEYYGINRADFDIDNDGIPSWWDLDSDGDLIADSLEVYSLVSADIDGDGLINSIDQDSDNNGISDSEEAGINIYQPLDSNYNSIPDFLDFDNDGDFIADLIDARPSVPIEISVLSQNPSEALTISKVSFIDGRETNQCKQNDVIDITVENVSELTSLYLIFTQGSEYQEVAYERTANTLRVQCNDLTPGAYNIIVSDGEVRSKDWGISVLAQNAITLESVELAGYYLVLKGSGFSQAFTFNYPQGAVDINNSSWSDDTEVNIYLPNDFDGGSVYLSNMAGSTDEFYINLKNSFSVNVTVDPVDGYTNQDLFIMSQDEDDISLAGGSGRIQTNVKEAEVIAILAYQNDTPFLLGYGAVLPSTYSIEINSASTAIGYLWPMINNDWTSPEAESILADLHELDEIKALGQFIYDGLALNIGFMASAEIYTSQEYRAAIDAINAYFITNNPVVSPITNIIKPTDEIDDILLAYENNEVSIENDTMLHLAYQVTKPSGELLCQYGVGLWSNNLIGLQSTFWKIASSATLCNTPQNASVRVLTPGIDVEKDAKLNPSQISAMEKQVRQSLALRTIIDGVILPIMMELLSQGGATSISKKEVVNIIIKEAPWIATEIAEASLGGQDWKSFFGNVMNKLQNDMLSYGPLTKALFEATFKDKASAVITKIAAKTAAKFVPLLGQFYAAWDYSSFIFAGVDTGKTITDLTITDTVIDFTLEFPLELESVSPAIVTADGQPKTFLINGNGFEAIDPGLFMAKVPPVIIVTNKQTNISVELAPQFISPDGTEMKVTLQGDFFVEDGTEYDVEVKQPAIDLSSSVLTSAITVETSLTLDYINPDEASVNDVVRIVGSGFSTNTNNNTLYFGGAELPVLSATSTEITFRIPFNTPADTYDIKIKRNDLVGSEWSNILKLVIADADINIRVCDNGSAKDDNFALDVNGVRIGQTYTTSAQYCFTFPVTVPKGANTAVLTGLDAPDGIGTYSIDFYGAESVSGDRQSGSDLVPGSTPKVYTFTAGNNDAPSSNLRAKVKAITLSTPVKYNEN